MPDPEYPRILLVITDGEVDDRNRTIAEVKRHSGECRVYSLGISSAVDKVLVNGIAGVGGGKSSFVVDNKDIEERVMGLFSEAFQPCTRKITVDWPSEKALCAPYKIPPIFKGDRMVAFALIHDDISVDTLSITAVDPMGQALSWKVPIIEQSGNLVHKLAAYSVIRALQEGTSEYHTRGEPDSIKIKELITKLGVTHQLATKYTSFVAVDERDNEAATGSLTTVNVESAKPVREYASLVTSKNTLSDSSDDEDKGESDCDCSSGTGSASGSGSGSGSPPSANPGTISPSPRSCSEPDSLQSAKPHTILLEEKNVEAKRSMVSPQKPSAPLKAKKAKEYEIEKKEKMKVKSVGSMRYEMDEEKGISVSPKQKEMAYEIEKEEVKNKSASPKGKDKLDKDNNNNNNNYKKKKEKEEKKLSDDKKDKKEAKAVTSGPTLKGKPENEQKSLIVSKQKFDGGWELPEIAYLLGISQQKIEAANPSVGPGIWATALGIAFLEVVLSKSKATWQMVAKKARTFITKALMKDGTSADQASDKAQTIIESATAFVKANF